MMKLALFLIAFYSISALAAEQKVECEVEVDTEGANGTITVDIESVGSRSLIRKIEITESDSEILFRDGDIHGGVIVGHCGQRRNEYLESIEKVSVSSRCVSDDWDRISFTSSLSLREEGKIRVNLFNRARGEIFEREITTDICTRVTTP